MLQAGLLKFCGMRRKMDKGIACYILFYIVERAPQISKL
jgi:hypothetical protein